MIGLIIIKHMLHHILIHLIYRKNNFGVSLWLVECLGFFLLQFIYRCSLFKSLYTRYTISAWILYNWCEKRFEKINKNIAVFFLIYTEGEHTYNISIPFIGCGGFIYIHIFFVVLCKFLKSTRIKLGTLNPWTRVVFCMYTSLTIEKFAYVFILYYTTTISNY